MELYVAVVDDTHADTDAQLFTSKARAVEWAVDQVPDRYFSPERAGSQSHELNDAMKKDGWVAYWAYSDSSSIWVMRREVRES